MPLPDAPAAIAPWALLSGKTSQLLGIQPVGLAPFLAIDQPRLAWVLATRTTRRTLWSHTLFEHSAHPRRVGVPTSIATVIRCSEEKRRPKASGVGYAAYPL